MSNEELGRVAAERFREEHSLGIEPIANMARLIERSMGIGVAYVDVPTAPGHGMTMSKDDKYLIAVGCTDHPMRLRSTLAHELGHLRLGTVDREVTASNWSERTPEEIQADAFARHLLVPLKAVSQAVSGQQVMPALLSDLVQIHLASPNIVAIQLRDVGAIDQATCKEWSSIATGTLAAQFGWHSEYQALVAQSRQPRAPQALLARAIEGYRWGLVSPAAIARLEGKPDQKAVADALAQDGIVPAELPDATAQQPEDTGQRLTPEELALLLGGAG